MNYCKSWWLFHSGLAGDKTPPTPPLIPILLLRAHELGPTRRCLRNISRLLWRSRESAYILTYALDVVMVTVWAEVKHWARLNIIGRRRVWLRSVKATIALVCEGVEGLGGRDGGSVFIEKLFHSLTDHWVRSGFGCLCWSWSHSVWFTPVMCGVNLVFTSWHYTTNLLTFLLACTNSALSVV